VIVDLFAGPGGWDEGLRMVGRADVVGVEWDRAACDTALAAGHRRLWADVAALDPLDVAACYGPAEGLIASPPCQAWSMAGRRKGEQDRASCHLFADRMAAGDDSTDWTTWEDERSALVCQPIRWARELRPSWIALEEVPAVASLWEHFARILTGWSYSTWTGDLNAADYGVPQTRVRRLLVARLAGPVGPPEPTHAEQEQPPDMFGGPGRVRWVSMGAALGWPEGLVGFPRRADTPSNDAADVVEIDGVAYRARDLFPTTGPAQVVTEKARSWALCVAPHGKFADAGRTLAEPAQTITAAPYSKGGMWWEHRPATTVVGSFRPDVIAAPGYRTQTSRQDAEGSVRVTPEQAAVLQSFPADYPWQGSRSRVFLQIGNAVPPLLAARVLAALGVGNIDEAAA